VTLSDGTDLEQAAAAWIAPYSQADHLVRAREWVIALDPAASEELRLAALTHDIERMFPGGPEDDKAGGDWVNPDYLFEHSTRSGDIVQWWIASTAPERDPAFAARVRRLILLHELGGDAEADVLQASDSLSWFDTLAPLAVRWVHDGLTTPEHAKSKLQWMADRIRHDRARELAAPLLVDALALVDLSQNQEVAP
jgi:hypothetical protein